MNTFNQTPTQQHHFLISRQLVADFPLEPPLHLHGKQTFETDLIETLEVSSHQSSLPAFTQGVQSTVALEEDQSAHRACTEHISLTSLAEIGPADGISASLQTVH